MDRRIALSVALGVLLWTLPLLLVLARNTARGPTPRDTASGFAPAPVVLAELRALRVAQERAVASLAALEAAAADAVLAPVGASAGSAARGRQAAGADGGADGDGAEVPGLAVLAARLDELRASLEFESRRTQEAIRSAPAFGGETLGDVRRRVTDVAWAALDGLEEDWRTDERSADRSQRFQTARDLLETYGPPSSIYRPKGGLLYVYRRHDDGQAGPAHYFRLQDGYVVEFFVEDEVSEGD
ncbi:MAG: hypothetical protein AAGB93_10490 [Planctomycetota bacterium]